MRARSIGLLIGLIIGISGCTSKDAAPAEPKAAEPAAAPAPAPAAEPAEDPVAAAKDIYVNRCTVCHGTTGKGDGDGSAALDPKPLEVSPGCALDRGVGVADQRQPAHCAALPPPTRATHPTRSSRPAHGSIARHGGHQGQLALAHDNEGIEERTALLDLLRESLGIGADSSRVPACVGLRHRRNRGARPRQRCWDRGLRALLPAVLRWVDGS